MDRQLSLDRAVGQKALRIKSIAEQITGLNATILRLRIAAQAAVARPDLMSALVTANRAAARYQDARLLLLRAEALPHLLAPNPWLRKAPEDAWGAHPIEPKSRHWVLMGFSGGLRSEASLFLGRPSKEGVHGSSAFSSSDRSDWSALWGASPD